jgi:hypothetical protein
LIELGVNAVLAEAFGEAQHALLVLARVVAIADKDFLLRRRHFSPKASLPDLTGFVRLELYLKRPENVAHSGDMKTASERITSILETVQKSSTPESKNLASY